MASEVVVVLLFISDGRGGAVTGQDELRLLEATSEILTNDND